MTAWQSLDDFLLTHCCPFNGPSGFPTTDAINTCFFFTEIVTGMRFSNDLKRLITVSGDG